MLVTPASVNIQHEAAVKRSRPPNGSSSGSEKGGQKRGGQHSILRSDSSTTSTTKGSSAASRVKLSLSPLPPTSNAYDSYDNGG